MVTQKAKGSTVEVEEPARDDASRSTSCSSSSTEMSEMFQGMNAHNYPPINIRAPHRVTTIKRLTGYTPAKPTSLLTPNHFHGPRVPFIRQDSNYSATLPRYDTSRPITPAAPTALTCRNVSRPISPTNSVGFRGLPIFPVHDFYPVQPVQHLRGMDDAVTRRLAELRLQQEEALRCVEEEERRLEQLESHARALRGNRAREEARWTRTRSHADEQPEHWNPEGSHAQQHQQPPQTQPVQQLQPPPQPQHQQLPPRSQTLLDGSHTVFHSSRDRHVTELNGHTSSTRSGSRGSDRNPYVESSTSRSCLERANLERAHRAQLLEVAKLEYDNANRRVELLTQYEREATRIDRPSHEASPLQMGNPATTLIPIIKKTRVQEPKVKQKVRLERQQDSSECSTEGSSYESAVDTDEAGSEDDELEPSTVPRQTMLLQAPVFSVVRSKDDDMVEWFRRFEMKAKAQGWSEKMMVTQAPLNFEDEAECIWDCLSTHQKADYHTMKKLMVKGMKKPGSEAATQHEYHSLRQEPGETPAQLCIRLKRLVQRSSGLKQLTEGEIARKFVQALHYDICSSLLNQRFRKIDSALKHAERIDNRRAKAERERSHDFSVNATAPKVSFSDKVHEIQHQSPSPRIQTPSDPQFNHPVTASYVPTAQQYSQPQYTPTPTTLQFPPAYYDPMYGRQQYASHAYQPTGYPLHASHQYNVQQQVSNGFQRKGGQRSKGNEQGCFKCGEVGHWKMDCPRHIKHQSQGRSDQLNGQTSYMEMQRSGQ